jgi:uncharacterized protein (TIGR03437 family)
MSVSAKRVRSCLFLSCSFLFAHEVPLTFEPTAQANVYWARNSTWSFRIDTLGAEFDAARLRFIAANPKAVIEPVNQLPSVSNHFTGRDPNGWRTAVPQFSSLRIRDLYTGIDAVWFGNQGEVEYDLIVRPGADPSQIRFRFDGASVRLRGGQLWIGSNLVQKRPSVYQMVDGKRKAIRAAYKLDNGTARFDLAAYDKSRPLVIDPPVAYANFVAGSGTAEMKALAVDRQGSAVLAGWARSGAFPAPRGTRSTNQNDCVIVKLNAQGTALLSTTILGGFGDDSCNGVALDSQSNIVVVGETAADDFPIRSHIKGSLGGPLDAFAAKFNPDGSLLLFSTYFGGSQIDVANAVAIDSTGAMYFTGRTASGDFPTGAAFDSTLNGVDAYVVKLDPSGAAYLYSTFLGGSRYDNGRAIAVDSLSAVYVTGDTLSPDFPVVNPIQPNFQGDATTPSAFVAKLGPTGGALEYSTYLNGTPAVSGCCPASIGHAIAVDSTGAAFVAGETTAPNFPVTAGAPQTAYGRNTDGFLAKFAPGGRTLAAATYIGGSSSDIATGLALDSTGVVVSGQTRSADLRLADPFRSTVLSRGDGFVMRFDSAIRALSWASYLGIDAQRPLVAVDTTGAAFVAGSAVAAGVELPNVRPIGDGVNGFFLIKVSSSATPPPPACTYVLTPLSVDLPLAGGTAPLRLETGPACVWTAQTGGVSWLTVAPASGTGPATLSVSATANAGGARSASIGVASASAIVNQAGREGPAAPGPTISAVTPSTLNFPGQVAFDAEGNMYIPDGNRVLRLAPNGTTAVVAGTGTAGYSGDGGPATRAQLFFPDSVEVDSDGNLLIADSANARIRRVDRNGNISTVAGGGSITGYPDGVGTSLQLFVPADIRFDQNGDLLFKVNGNAVAKLGKDGRVTFVTRDPTPGFSGDFGPALRARFRFIGGVTPSPTGEIFISDTDNHRIRVVKRDGVILPLAGTGQPGSTGDGGFASDARLNRPQPLATDYMGNLYFWEQASGMLRRIDPRGRIEAIAGPGTALGPLGNAQNLATDRFGDLYISEQSATGRIRKVTFPKPRHGIESVSSSYASSPVITPGSLFFIEGRNLGASSLSQDVTALELGNVKVTVNGMPAYLRSVVDSFILALVPDIETEGPVTIEVTNPTGAVRFEAPLEMISPVLYPFLLNGVHYVAVSPADNLEGPFIGTPSRPVRPGESIVLYASGLGKTDPPLEQDKPLSAPLRLASLEGFSLRIGEIEVAAPAVEMRDKGRFQIRFEVPRDLPDGTHPVTLTVSGKSAQSDLQMVVAAPAN